VKVLCDGAQAHGARHGGSGLGGLGDAVAWSFYPTKNLGALGDGGAVTTNDPDIEERLRVLRHYGFGPRSRASEVVGANSRLDELQAALLRVKLPHLEAWNAARREQADVYREALASLDVELQEPTADAIAVWHHFVLRCADREKVQAALADRGVQTLVHYPVPPFAQPAFTSLGIADDAFPIAGAVATQVLSLPMGLHVSTRDQERIINLLYELLPKSL
jgi:dTDP-4-amino-4,6-dideoxygalactose transaminase